jgi:multidrug efflux pump
VPLAIALGAGMNARHSLGTGIIGGMIGASSLALLYVPLFFYLFEQLAERGGKKDEAKTDDATKEDANAPAAH